MCPSLGFHGVWLDTHEELTGKEWLDTHEELTGKEWLEFTGIPAMKTRAISTEQQFAEKNHFYSLPRQTPNSRTKDLIDLILLIENCNFDPKHLQDAITKTFKRRKRTKFRLN